MPNQNWARIADLYARVSSLGAEERQAVITAENLSAEEAATLERLLLANARETGFFHTGGGITTELQILETGALVGNWRILELIGAGGMGEVYRVERADGHFTQIAALKRITISDEQAYQRFERERQILAQLEHPHIARLIDGGVGQDGAPYLVMEYIEGEMLGDYAKAQSLSREQILRHILKVCDALSHAHNRFVLHRDLKPSNILITPLGEIKLIDFGVAGLVGEADSDLHAPMTLHYAAPEQLEGKPVSVQTDVFALGVTLGEILTSEAPESALSEGKPGWAGLPRDLRAILTKAANKIADMRYESIEAFSRDLKRYLTSYPVVARQGSLAYQGGLFLKRNALAVALFVALSIGLGATYWQYQTAETQRDVALQERERLRTMQSATFLMFSQVGETNSNTTAHDLIRSAAEQASIDFENHPQDAAPVLHMFGELLYLINDYPAAEPILKSVSELQVSPENEDIIARASHDLANVLIRSGKTEEAHQALSRALNIWAQDQHRYADQLLESILIESQLATAENDPVRAETLLENALPKRIAFSGETSLDTAILMTNLGVARMRIGDFDGAITVSEDAKDIYKSQKKLETPDGLNTMNNLATLYHITGSLEDAESAYRATLSLRRSLYGPSAALAVLMSNYGKLKLQTGAVSDAISLLEEALPMADEFAGEASPPAIAVRFGLIEALASDKATERAAAILAETTELLQVSGQFEGAYEGLSHLAKAQVLLAEEQQEMALSELDLADEAFTELGPAGGRYLVKSAQLRKQIK